MAASSLSDLFEAINNSDKKLVIDISRTNPELLTTGHIFQCNFGDCTCQRKSTPLRSLLSGPQNGRDEHMMDRFEMLEQLFEQKIIRSDNISDEILCKVIQKHCGWDYNSKLLDLFLKYIPANRWVAARTNEKWSGICTSDNLTVFQCVMYSHMDYQQTEHYFRIFFDMGCDPSLPIDGDPDYHVLGSLICYAHDSLIKLYFSKHRADINKLHTRTPDFSDNPVMRCLIRYSESKDPVEWEHVKQTMILVIQHGLDLTYKNNNGETVHDYIDYYGWREILQGIVQMPPGAGDNIRARKISHAAAKPAKKRKINRSIEKIFDMERRYEFSGINLVHIPEPTETEMTSLEEMKEFVERKLKQYRYRKDTQLITELETEFLEYLAKIDSKYLDKVKTALHNSYSRAYGWLYHSQVETFFREHK